MNAARMRRGARSREGEKEFLAAYRRSFRYARPAVTVDLCVFTVQDGLLQVLLIRRKEHPFRGCWALPGGFVDVGDAFADQGEDLERAAARELAEETGLPEGSIYLEQLYTFGDSGRDPRLRVITVAYYALIPPDLAGRVRAGSDAAGVAWVPVGELPKLDLAFDHSKILGTAVARLRGKLDDSNAAFELVPRRFTIAELRAVHEVVKGTAYDPGNFRRRFRRMLEDGIIERAPGKRLTATKPATLYRFTGREEPGRP